MISLIVGFLFSIAVDGGFEVEINGETCRIDAVAFIASYFGST